MQILYTSDNEVPSTMDLETLIRLFDENGGWACRHNETDMRNDLASRGWYGGLHNNGRYLALNLDLLPLDYRDPAMDE